MEERKYGWKPSLGDSRDRRLKFSPFLHAQLPVEHSLRDRMPPVRHQLNLGSCTAKVICSLAQYREMNGESPRDIVPSTLFQYYNTRFKEGTAEYDSGASLRSAILALQEYGICDVSCCPYAVEQFRERPPAVCYEQAKVYSHVEAHKIDQTLGSIRAAVFNGDPVAFGFTVYSAFENAATMATGVVNLPGPGEVVLGGHAVLLVGYNDATGRFLIRNSYGADWGDLGHFTMPYEYVLSRDLCDDFWTFKAFR